MKFSTEVPTSKVAHQAPRGSREVKVKSPTLRRSSENQAIESSGSAAKSRGLDLDLEFQCITLFVRTEVGVREIEVSKLLRACGGCLGAERR